MTGRALALAAFVACGRDAGPTPPTTAKTATPTATATSTAAAAATTAAAPPLTPDAFLAAGPPTLVVGTLGDDDADRAGRAQAALVRSLLTDAKVVTDLDVDVSRGAAGWPPRPIVIGGVHVNAAARALGAALPRVDAAAIEIGGETVTAPGVRLIAAVPARASATGGPGHPALLYYAGTGTPGVVELNAVRHGGEPILLADAFGRWRTGRWIDEATGDRRAVLDAPAPRIEWRIVPLGNARVAFPAQLAPQPDESTVVDAIARGVSRAVARLELAAPHHLTVYVHPDARSKASLTGDGGAGHAIALAGSLHVLRSAPASIERLVAHEATHVLAGLAWGPAGTALVGEGLAVWVADGYAGHSLAQLEANSPPPPVEPLLPMRAFRSAPERATYPTAGLFLQRAISAVGLAAVRDHLYPAAFDAWDEARRAAGLVDPSSP